MASEPVPDLVLSRATILPSPSPEILVTLLRRRGIPEILAAPKAVSEPSSGTLLTEIEREFQESRQIIAPYGVLRSRSLPTMYYPCLTRFRFFDCVTSSPKMWRAWRESPLDRDDYLVAAKVGNTWIVHFPFSIRVRSSKPPMAIVIFVDAGFAENLPLVFPILWLQ